MIVDGQYGGLTIEDAKQWGMRIMGYSIEDLIIFADACRRAGVEDWELHTFAMDAQAAVDYALETIKDVRRACQY